MRAFLWLSAVVGLVNALALDPRDPPKSHVESWRPKTHSPEFFSIKVDDRCDGTPGDKCPFASYALRLQDNITIATHYNEWWDPKLPIFLVDDDTQCYTVSKKPLQLYVNIVTGALQYAPVGWLPVNSIAISFYETGNNPLGRVDPNLAYFAWPSIEGRTERFGASTWWLCPLSNTGQYQVFISDVNFGASKQGGVNTENCVPKNLAAVNANPWAWFHACKLITRHC